MADNRAEIAARVRKNCNKGLGENCACANLIAKGDVDLEKAVSFLDSLLVKDSRPVVVIDDEFGLASLFLGFILRMPEGSDLDGPLNMSGIDLFDGVEDAVVVEESDDAVKVQEQVVEKTRPASAVSVRRTEIFALNVPLSRQTIVPGKGERAHITKVDRREKGSGRSKGWGSSKIFKGGKGGN